ncbi:hypothetical protein IFM89_020143, partial [Coptis chinensis]
IVVIITIIVIWFYGVSPAWFLKSHFCSVMVSYPAGGGSSCDVTGQHTWLILTPIDLRYVISKVREKMVPANPIYHTYAQDIIWLELIFGAIEYTMTIDMWYVGCVLAELLLGRGT